MIDPESFAARWADAWNGRDVEGVLVLFHDDIVFESPTALAVTGSAVVRGKAALRDYWNAAMGKITSLRFIVERVIWDDTRQELAIVYTAAINGSAKKVSENLLFDDGDKIVAAEVFHGVPVP